MKKGKQKIKNPKGAGRKPRFKIELGETTTFSCRVPKVKKQELIDYVAVKLAEWSQGSA
jgi:hypothetical protein